MFSKIFSKTKSEKKGVSTAKQQQQHQHQKQQKQQTSSSAHEVSPHHMYYPLQLQQQYPQLYTQNTEQHKLSHHRNSSVNEQQQLQQQQQYHLATDLTTTSLESLFHPSKLVTNLSESPGRSRKLRKEFEEGPFEVDNNIENETTERSSAQQQQQQHHHQDQQQQTSSCDDKESSADDVTCRTNMTYDCCPGNEPYAHAQHPSSNSWTGFNVTVQQSVTNSPIYNFSSSQALNKNNNDEGLVTSQTTSPVIGSLLSASKRSPTALATPRSNSFRNCSQQDLQQFDLLQQNVSQQQQQQQQLMQLSHHSSSDREVKFYPVRYRSLSAGDHTNFTCDISETTRTDGKSNKRNKWGSESEGKWGGKGERSRIGGGGGGGMMWGSTRKHVTTGSNQISTLKSTSSEQFYRSVIGQVFLICGREMKRCVLLQKIGSLDAVRQIFSQAFSEVVRIEGFYGPDPPLTIYILDTVAAVFYELEDYREVRNLSVLKIFEKKPQLDGTVAERKSKATGKKTSSGTTSQMQTSTSAHTEGMQASNLGSVQSLPPPSPQSRPEFEALKMKTREVCCFGGVVGYQKLTKAPSVVPKPTLTETDVVVIPRSKPGIEPESSGLTCAGASKASVELHQAKQYHSLDRCHSAGCHHHHHHHQHHRPHKKGKVGTQSASASPSSDPYGHYSLYGSHCGCCRHHHNCDSYVQQCGHHHHHNHQQLQQLTAVQSPAKQSKSPSKNSQQRQTWAGHPPYCHNSCRPLSEHKTGSGGGGSNNCILPVDLLDTTSGGSMNEERTSAGVSKKAPGCEMETRMRISQLENQLASLTQWVRNSTEAERSDFPVLFRREHDGSKIGNASFSSSADSSQTLQTIQGRLGDMLKDVTQLRDQCQHLKMAHHVQRQEIHEALVFFSKKIVNYVSRGSISEDAVWSSLAQGITSLQFIQHRTNSQQLLEAAHAELLECGGPEADADGDGMVGDTTPAGNNPDGKDQLGERPKSVPRDLRGALDAPSALEAAHSPDLVRSYKGSEFPKSTTSDPDDLQVKGESSDEVWISMGKLNRLSSR